MLATPTLHAKMTSGSIKRCADAVAAAHKQKVAMGGNAVECSADAFAAAHKQKVVMPMGAVPALLLLQCKRWVAMPSSAAQMLSLLHTNKRW